jgi:hypothetical protein
MDNRELIAKEIENIPELYLEEVLDFIKFLKAKALSHKIELALITETSLKKDWLSLEEEEAWKDL